MARMVSSLRIMCWGNVTTRRFRGASLCKLGELGQSVRFRYSGVFDSASSRGTWLLPRYSRGLLFLEWLGQVRRLHLGPESRITRLHRLNFNREGQRLAGPDLLHAREHYLPR